MGQFDTPGGQITVGLLTDVGGFPLMASALEGNKAETKTMLLVIKSFMAAHGAGQPPCVCDLHSLAD